MGLRDKKTNQLPIDEKGLETLQEHMTHVINDCLDGTTAIGNLLACVGELETSDQVNFARIGSTLENLGNLARDAHQQLEYINMALQQRQAKAEFNL